LRNKIDFGRAPFELRHLFRRTPPNIVSNSLGNFRLLNPSFTSHKPLGFG
jgi:hypothetical protein